MRVDNKDIIIIKDSIENGNIELKNILSNIHQEYHGKPILSGTSKTTLRHPSWKSLI